MTRKELLNSPEYWQGIAENQCYRENIDYTLQLVDKKQIIDKANEWLKENVDKYLLNTWGGTGYVPKCSIGLFSNFKKAMEG